MCCNVKGCGKGCGCTCSRIGRALVVFGGINWGLIGLGMLSGNIIPNWNIVNVLFGRMPTLEALIYVLIGASAVMLLTGCKCKKCKAGVCHVHGARTMHKHDDNKAEK